MTTRASARPRLAAPTRAARVVVAIVGLMLACTSGVEAGGWISEDGDVAIRRSIDIPVGQRLDTDLLAIAGNVVVAGDIVGDVVAIRGDVVVRGKVTGDVLAILGRVRVEGPSGQIDGDVGTLLGGVDVVGDASLGGGADFAGSADLAGGAITGDVRTALVLPEGRRATYLAVALQPTVLALRLLLIAAWTLLALAAAFAVPGPLVRAAAGLSGRLFAMTLTGALFHLSVILVAILFTALVVVGVGVPLLGLLFVAMALFEGLALGASFYRLGERITERRPTRTTSGYAKILLGALVVGAISFVPVLGELAWCIASCAGAGAVLATWRRRG